MLRQFVFSVSIDASTSPATFTIFDSQGNPTDAPITVTEPGTVISYQLREDSSAFTLLPPEITGDDAQNLSYTLSKDGQSLVLNDTDGDMEDVCLKLVAVPTESLLVSPDPQVRNRPRN